MAVLRTSDFAIKGLRYLGCPERMLGRNVSFRTKINRFKANFGQLPLVHLKIWSRLASIDSDRNEERFFMTLFWLKTYPTESVLSVRFGIDEDTVRDWLWYYVECLAILKEDLIQMPENFPDEIKFPVVIDGTHMMIYEPMHELWPMDPDYYGHKRKTASYNYQMVLSTFEPRLYRVDGPFPAGSHSDVVAFQQSGLQEVLLSQGKSKSKTMKPKALRETRDEYRLLPLKVFRDRINAEVLARKQGNWNARLEQQEDDDSRGEVDGVWSSSSSESDGDDE